MRGFRVATLFGIPLELNPSWVVIVVILLWSLASAVFPGTAPGLSSRAYAVMGLLTTLLFFASLVAHELSHSLVSQHFGLKVRRIVLFVFGGVSETTHELPNPRVEFLVAIAGPMMSFLLAAVFTGLAQVFAYWGLGAMLSIPCAWLGVVNLALGLFNLVPGFPLDGGRLLRAAAWKITGSLQKATRIASRGGQAVGVLMLVWAVWRLLGGDWFGAIWIGMLGTLLYQAAGAEYGQMVITTNLSHMSVGELMTPHPVVLSPDMTLQEVVNEHLLRQPYGGYPVVDAHLDGVLAANQVKSVPSESWGSVRVSEVMTRLSDGDVLTPTSSAAEVVERFSRLGIGRVPVVDHGEVVGIVSQSDVIRWLVWHPQEPPK